MQKYDISFLITISTNSASGPAGRAKVKRRKNEKGSCKKLWVGMRCDGSGKRDGTEAISKMNF